MATQDDLTAERAANLYGSLTCTTYREGYQDPDNDIALLANALKTARQDALREAAKVVRDRAVLLAPNSKRWELNMVTKAKSDVAHDLADTLDRLASEGG